MSEKKWDATRIPDQTGRVVIVTGSSSGIGYEAARVLAARNAEVILAAETDDQGRSEGSKLAENIFTLDDDKIVNARNSEFIRVLVRVNSDEREIRKPVQILNSNRFDLRISMQTNVDLDI